jgi:uncharacterized protein YoxC
MSLALQIALFLASISIVALSACLIPMLFQARRRMNGLLISAGQLKAELEDLVKESRALVKDVKELTDRASLQMDDLGQTLHTGKKWVERIDKIAGEVASAVEPPVFSFVRHANLLRTGASAFIGALFGGGGRSKTQEDANHGK